MVVDTKKNKELTCCKCKKTMACIILKPCEHLSYCDKCFDELEKEENYEKICPICKKVY